MSATVPMLTSIKSQWDSIHEAPVIGKDVLELLSSSMYINPLAIFREYVQNSADSIDEAVGLGLLRSQKEGRVEINIDPQERSITIRDNGTGISRSQFSTRLVALGASRKRGTKARGFRGVGRLAGLGYCQELLFRSRADGEREISELRWDCRRLKTILRDAQFADELGDVIQQVVRVRRHVDTSLPERFFEVQLLGIVRHGSDALVNSAVVEAYLSQVAPVPFSPEFSLARDIEAALAKLTATSDLHIFLNGSETPLFRPHRDSFLVRKGLSDRFTGLNVFQIEGSTGTPSAIGWVAHHGYHGAISSDSKISGLRLRSGNMQIGESDLLNGLFQESRFNGWVVGEIHVLDERILPNGRRDHFEQSVHFNDMVNQLAPIANDLSRRCRTSSIQRNWLRQFDLAKSGIDQAMAIVQQGAVPQSRRKYIEGEIDHGLDHLKKICSNRVFDAFQKSALTKKLERLEAKVEKIFAERQEHKSLISLPTRDRKTYEYLFSLIYECSTTQTAAKALVDQLLKRIGEGRPKKGSLPHRPRST